MDREELKYTERLFYFHYLQSGCLLWDKTNIHNQYWRNAGLRLMYPSNWSRNHLSLCKSYPCKSAKVSVTSGSQLLEALAKLNCLEQALNLHTRLLWQNICVLLYVNLQSPDNARHILPLCSLFSALTFLFGSDKSPICSRPRLHYGEHPSITQLTFTILSWHAPLKKSFKLDLNPGKVEFFHWKVAICAVS